MCGIVGMFGPKGSRLDVQAARRATRTIRHRGPDSSGEWIRAEGDAFLGFQRLSIVDVTSNSDQPMHGPWGSVLVFNGEIYNYRDLRTQLEREDISFRSRGDAEVLLQWLLNRGVEQLSALLGMFAFVFWDESKRCATAARDFFGIKPLYYWRPPTGGVVFTSETKSLLALPDFNPRLEESCLPEYLRFRSLCGANTLLADVRQVLPGQMLVYNQLDDTLVTRTYWSAVSQAEEARSMPPPSEEELHALLKDSIRQHLIADVPVGTQFSGGIDSGLVSAIAAAELRHDIRGFHCHVHGSSYDETPFARMTASHIGIQQEETSIGVENLLAANLEALTWHMDEPLGHPNAAGVFAVASLARGKVKALLSGEGADEIFAGYYRYSRLLLAEQLRKRVPNVFRLLPSHFLQHPKLLRFVNFARNSYGVSTEEDILRGTQFSEPGDVARILPAGERRPDPGGRLEILRQLRGFDVLTGCQLYDVLTYLPPLLIRQDKMSMAASIENRVPFVTPVMFQMAMRIAPEERATPFKRKKLLTKIAMRYLPAATVTRPKMGFGVPLGDYLLTEIGRDRLYSLALDGLLDDYCDKYAIRRLVGTFDGSQIAAEPLWNLIALAAWVDVFIRRNHPPLE